VQYLGDVSSPSPFHDGQGVRLEKSNYYIGYAQDEWKIHPGLTFSYGSGTNTTARSVGKRSAGAFEY
jgi:hypothetical protein